MKLKYYLRGLGIGIIVTTIIMMIAFAIHKPEMSDGDVIAKAKQLGMVMPEDDGKSENIGDTQIKETTDTSDDTETSDDTDTLDNTEILDNTERTQELQVAQTEENSELYTLIVEKGDVCRVICEDLQENGLIDDAEAFRKFLLNKGLASSISVGSYSVPFGSDYETIYQILKAGPQ